MNIHFVVVISAVIFITGMKEARMTDWTKSGKMREGLKVNGCKNWQRNFCHLHQLIFVVFIFAVIILITKAWLSL